MTIDIRVNRLRAKILLVTGLVLLTAAFVRQIGADFIVSSLANDRAPISTSALEAAAAYFPGSSRIQARLAEAEINGRSRNLPRALKAAVAAARLSPNDYRVQVILAAVEEASGDRPSAERALAAAHNLAPFNVDVQWRLANLLLREGKNGEGLQQLARVLDSESSLAGSSVDTAWTLTGGDLPGIERMVSASGAGRLALANLLLKQGRIDDAAGVFQRTDSSDLATLPAASEFVSSLMQAGDFGLARRMWLVATAGVRDNGQPNPNDRPLVSNGGFETDPPPGLGQFAWSLQNTPYADIGLDSSVAHTGKRSLRIDFAGRDTTRLDGEVRQLTALRPGSRYALSFFAKTMGLVTTDGPRVAVSSPPPYSWSAASAPIVPGTSDWQQYRFEFEVPVPASKPAAAASASASQEIPATITLVRTPRYAYDEPMRGSIWLDDFQIDEIH